jgi:3-hydroxyacyl-[acyl-carrier-protein] dehydratase
VRFHLLDRIDSIDATSLTAVKAVTQAEEYLADHFPSFPVLPGVLMLEAATQAAAWHAWWTAGLLTDNYFGPTVLTLKAARNIRYGHFVAPGRVLHIKVEQTKDLAYKVAGTVDAGQGETSAFGGKLELAAERVGRHDDRLAEAHRKRWHALDPTGHLPTQP